MNGSTTSFAAGEQNVINDSEAPQRVNLVELLLFAGGSTVDEGIQMKEKKKL